MLPVLFDATVTTPVQAARVKLLNPYQVYNILTALGIPVGAASYHMEGAYLVVEGVTQLELDAAVAGLPAGVGTKEASRKALIAQIVQIEANISKPRLQREYEEGCAMLAKGVPLGTEETYAMQVIDKGNADIEALRVQLRAI